MSFAVGRARSVLNWSALLVGGLVGAIAQETVAQTPDGDLFELSIDVPDLVIVARPPLFDLVIDVPDLTVVGRPDPYELVINVPDLVITGRPPLFDLVIDVPDLTIVGRPDPYELVIDVPVMTIIGRPPLTDLVIDVPALTIVGRAEEPDAQSEDAFAENARETQTHDPDEDTPPSPEASTPQQADPSLAQVGCHGDYTAHFGRGVGTAIGFAMPFGQNLTVPARVDVLDCGTSLSATIQGQRVGLTYRAQSAQFVGSINLGDGAQRTLVLECGDDRNLRGQLIASDPNLTIERPVWMMQDAPSAVDLTQCADP